MRRFALRSSKRKQSTADNEGKRATHPSQGAAFAGEREIRSRAIKVHQHLREHYGKDTHQRALVDRDGKSNDIFLHRIVNGHDDKYTDDTEAEYERTCLATDLPCARRQGAVGSTRQYELVANMLSKQRSYLFEATYQAPSIHRVNMQSPRHGIGGINECSEVQEANTKMRPSVLNRLQHRPAPKPPALNCSQKLRISPARPTTRSQSLTRLASKLPQTKPPSSCAKKSDSGSGRVRRQIPSEVSKRLIMRYLSK